MKNVADIYPLTPTQNGMLYHALRDPDPELYFEQVRCDLVGPLDLGRFKAAWDAVFDRHPALRTAFVWGGVKQPVQVVRETVGLPWTEFPGLADMADMADMAGHRDLDSLAAANRAKGWDLQRAPVSRFTVVGLGADRAHFIWDFHHILLDGWSATRVFDEALAIYNQSEKPRQPEPIGRPFRQYLEWLTAQDGEAAERYWTKLLADHPGSPEVLLRSVGPQTRDRPEVSRVEHTVPAELVAELRDFARAHRITLNTVLQGAWAVVLGRYADTDDVTFGIVTSGRPADLDHVEDIVGMFLAALPLRANLASDGAMSEWLGELHRQQLDSIDHQHSALADIRTWAGLPAGEELFDSVLVFENFPVADEPKSASLRVEDKHVFEQTHYGLTVMVRPADELHLSTLFDPLRFSRPDVTRMIDLLIETLRVIPSNPTAPSPLLDTDRAFLLQVNDTAVPFDHDATLHDLVIEQARRTPDARAVMEHDTGVAATFRDLDERSSHLARALTHDGVRSGDAVGVSLDRSIDQVVALLAVWRAGAAYVPLDPAHPIERRELMIDRAGIDVVLDRARFEQLEAGPSRGAELVAVGATQAACITFTSGSSGQPKPVELHHRGIVNRCQWQLATYPLLDDEVCVAKTTLNFVDHLWELWGPLIGGSSVVLLADGVVLDPKCFASALFTHGIKRLTLVPSLLDAVLDDFANADVGLQWVTVSGETTPSRLAERVADVLPQVALLNFYGMSEGTADATWFDTSRTPDNLQRADGSVPIGRPVSNMSISVLDRHQRSVPLGVAGELYVGGVGVASGYRGQPALTEQHFVLIDGQRCYRTGDMGRWNDEGQLEFLGRRDRQVKIRGVRVEPEEVEAELKRHPLVADAVVSSVGEGARQLLVAHLVPRPTAASERPDQQQLLDWAHQHLPASLVPSRLRWIDGLPTLATGKIDRAALTELAAAPAPTEDGADQSHVSASAGPLSEVESTMIGLWQNVLGIEDPISLDADFFEIGGNSLLAVQLFSRIDRAFSRDLALAEVFEAPTPTAMLTRLGLGPSEAATRDSSARSGAPRPVLHLVSAQPERFEPLRRRLGRTATLRVSPSVAELMRALKAPIDQSESDAPLHLAGHGVEAALAIEALRQLEASGRTTQSMLFIDAALARSGLATDAARPEEIFFFEPSETASRVPILDSPELRLRLDDRMAWTDAADVVDTILVPGTPDDLLTEPNVSWLANLIGDRVGSTTSWTHLVPIGEPTEDARRLFAVHGEFGNVVGYRDLAVALGPAWSVVGVQASGVHGTQPLHRSIEEMAEAYLAEVTDLQPKGPYLIGGYSSGGTVAFEMARRLRAAGEEVEPVLWFDHYRVEATRAEPRSKQLARLAGNRLKAALTDREAFQAGLKRRELQRKVDTILAGNVGEREWWWAITEMADDRAEAENIRSMLIGDNMREARSRYRHASYDGPILLYQAHTVDAGREPDRGWGDNDLNLTRVAVPGDHTSLLLEPNVGAIAEDLHRRFPTRPL